MNRILLTSSLSLSNAVIDAHNKGISQPEIFHAANVLDQLERGSRRVISTPKAIIKKMVAAKVKDVSLIVASDLTRGQIAYAITKHQEQQKAAKKTIAKGKKQKQTEIFAKLPTVRPSVTKLAAKAISSKTGSQKTIKFSAPLKVVTANVQSFC